MSVRKTAIAGAALAMLLVPGLAAAAPGFATGDVNMRTGPGVQYGKIQVIPAGARVNVQWCRSWCQLTFRGATGFASANYISTAPGPRFRRPPPPRYGYMRRPWWDDRRGAWYDGNRWYFGGRWYDRPSGFSFGLSFGG